MKKFFLSVLSIGLLIGFSAYGSDDTADFDAGTDIKPLTKELSAAEAVESTDLDDVDYGQKLPELSCFDERLKRQVANLIYSYVNRDKANSVIEQREHYLMTRNLHDFVEEKDTHVTSEDNYSAASAIAYLKINQNKEIYKVCRSSGNNSKKFADLFAVIYRDGAYYQVVVPNIMNSTKDIEKATFTFNW